MQMGEHTVVGPLVRDARETMKEGKQVCGIDRTSERAFDLPPQCLRLLWARFHLAFFRM